MIKYRFYLYSLLFLILDQASKLYIRTVMDIHETIKVTPRFLWITYVHNTGAAFSISLGTPLVNRIIFSFVTFLAVILLAYMIKKSISNTERLGFSLIMGGAAGNLIDRIWLGRVTDFIDCDFPDIIMQRWPIFNVADSCVVTGVVLLGIYYLFVEKRRSKSS